MDRAAIEVAGLTKKFGRRLAVDRLTFSVPTAAFAAFWDATEQGRAPPSGS